MTFKADSFLYPLPDVWMQVQITLNNAPELMQETRHTNLS